MKIRIETLVNSDMARTWAAWNTPEDINRWNAASADWHTPYSSVDLRVGGGFLYRMEARDGSMGFDFKGTYSNIIEHERIEYELEDGRSVVVEFGAADGGIRVTEIFEADSENSPDLQRQGWQSILDNFARHVASKS